MTSVWVISDLSSQALILVWIRNKPAFETLKSPYGRSGWQVWQGV
jgi:hypothetical protein